MNEVTITIPAIDTTVIANLETLTTETLATEVAALCAIRERYAPLARQNGYVRIGFTYRGNVNWSDQRDYYYKRDGKRGRALRCVDNFDSAHSDQNSGRRVGDRLYLLESGEWLRIERDGNWSNWQGAPEQWACGDGIIDDENGSEFSEPNAGSIRIINDEDVAAEYEISAVIAGLAKSLATLAEKIPERLTRVRQRAALASSLLDALREV